MKRTSIIVLSVGVFIICGIVAYYLLIVSPKIAQDRLNFEKEKQTNLEKSKKEERKQKCLDIQSKAYADASKGATPNVYLYRIENESCE